MTLFEPSDVLKSLPEQFFAKLTKKAAAFVEQGHNVINLGQGNPDLPTPDHIVESLQIAAKNPKYHKYSPFDGYLFVKEAIATFYKNNYDVDIDPEKEVALLFGGKTGLVHISQCLLNEKDVALVPDPGYPDYWSGIALAKAEMKMMPLVKENNFLPDYTTLSEDELNRAKLMFLNYPSNPTAAIANETFFNETVKLAKKHHICIVHDFAYGAIGYDGEKPLSFLQIEGAKHIGIEIYTLSKTFNMAGWRVAFAVGNESVIKSINLIQDHYYCSLFGAVQEAAATALLHSDNSIEELVNTYERRRNVFITELRNIGWDVDFPKGSFFTWLPVPEGFTSESFADFLLEQAHIVVAPGNGFGEHGEGYVRAGIVSDEQLLLEAVNRIDKLQLFR